MNRVKHLPNLFLCRPTSFSQCRKLLVDKPIRLRAVSLFARGVREHACASIQQRSRETRETLPPRAFSHMRVSRILLDGRRKKRLLVVYRPMGITEPGVTRTRLLCLGTKLYPGNKQATSSTCSTKMSAPKSGKWKKDSASRVGRYV